MAGKRTSVGSSIPLSWALFIASFFLPTVSAGGGTDNGASALGAALAFGGIFGVISALTNAVFMASTVVLFRRNRTVLTVLATLAGVSFLINLWWFIESFGDDLLIGYYVWLIAFAVLAVGLLMLLRATPRPSDNSHP